MVGIQEPVQGSKKPIAPIQDRSYVKWDENDQEEFELQLCKSVSIRDRVRMLETIARYDDFLGLESPRVLELSTHLQTNSAFAR